GHTIGGFHSDGAGLFGTSYLTAFDPNTGIYRCKYSEAQTFFDRFTPAHRADQAGETLLYPKWRGGTPPPPRAPPSLPPPSDPSCSVLDPASLDPAWRTPSVTNLAIAASEERLLPSGQLDPQRLLVLADALEDAGCDSAEVLGHLRGPGVHVRGCWAVDLLTGRQ